MNEDDQIEQLRRVRQEKAELELAILQMRARLLEVDQQLTSASRTPGNSFECLQEPKCVSEIVNSIVARIEPIKERSMRRIKTNVQMSVIEMAEEVLRGASRNGFKCLSAPEITERIKQSHWPEAENRLVGPQLWRAAKKEGRLLKVGAKYSLTDHTNLR